MTNKELNMSIFELQLPKIWKPSGKTKGIVDRVNQTGYAVFYINDLDYAVLADLSRLAEDNNLTILKKFRTETKEYRVGMEIAGKYIVVFEPEGSVLYS